jgi:hypothetical protein
MIKLEQRQQKFSLLRASSPGELMRRHNLKEFIFNSPAEFFGEVGQRLFLIGKDIETSGITSGRIDLLALDEQGQGVVIVFPQDRDPSLLARAITSTGLISKWKPADFLQRLSARRAEELKRFLQVGVEHINREQRAILISEFFDFEVLAASKWLWQRNGMDQTCLRIFSCFDPDTGAEYLGCVDLSDTMAPLPVNAEASQPALLPQPAPSSEDENAQPEAAVLSHNQAEAVAP